MHKNCKILQFKMSRRSRKTKTAITGLRSVQNLGALAVPGTLEKVPEDKDVERFSLKKPAAFGTDDWKCVENAIRDIIRKEFDLTESGRIYDVHQSIKNILKSRTGQFLVDCCREWMAREMETLSFKLRYVEDNRYLAILEEIWTNFYRHSICLLDTILYLIKPKSRLSIRNTALVIFRDIVFFAGDVEEAIDKAKEDISPEIRNSVLVLQNVSDSYPPCKNKLRIEAIVAKICSPFMGFLGLYENGELVFYSNEPTVILRKKPNEIAPRRISRPFSVQPQQMETLNQMFKSAVRHK